MFDFLYTIDKNVFYFFNQTLSNPFFDFIMPPLTNWNQSWFGLGVVAVLWLLLFLKGGRKGKIVAVLIILLIAATDQLSSSFIKNIVARPRPCHDMDGMLVLDKIHLLVPCGSGFSFPSSHAVNNFAFAAFMSYYYRRWRWVLFSFATLMGFSRISVGVHYPSDVIGGAIIGISCAYMIIIVWELLSKKYPNLILTRDENYGK